MRRTAVAAALGLTLGLLAVRSPTGAEAPDWPVFMGGLHTHTGYSDGVPDTSPADAYARARDVEGLDFLAVTEHSETLPTFSTFSEACLPTEGGTLVECALVEEDEDPARALDKWEAQRRMAVAETRLAPNPFLALRGFEWSSDVFGHINVYFSRNYTSWMADGGAASMETFYRWLQTPPLLGGGADGLATFNHPGDKTICNAGVEEIPGSEPVCGANPLDNWNDFAYVAELDDRIVGVEVFNRNRTRYEDEVVRALDAGWHLGMVGAEDIHEDTWGSSVHAKTAFLAPRLTPLDLKEAMRARRMYATLDPSIRLSFTADGNPMGSRLPASSASLDAEVTGGDTARIDLLTKQGVVFASASRNNEGLALNAPAVTAGGEHWFMARVSDSTGKPVAYSSPIWLGSPAPKPFTPRWVAGDLHVHTTYSHDSWEGPHDDNTGLDEAYTFGWTPGQQIAIAESRGLDFVAITDHNDVRAAYDAAFTSDQLTLIPSYENSLAGHAQMINTPYCLTPEGPTVSFIGCNNFTDRNDPARVEALANRLRDSGGAFQINHPSDGDWVGRFGNGASPNAIVPDSIEVWNIGPWHWQHPAPASNDNDFSLEFWQTYLNAGHKVAATGGSDNHWRSTTAAQGVGQPTTWVYVTKPGPEGIVEGIRAGRTFVAAQPPAYGGPRLYFDSSADPADGTFEALPGDTVPGGSLFRWRLENAPPNSRVAVYTRDGLLTRFPAAPLGAFDAGDDPGWVRLELITPDAPEERRQYCDPNASQLLDLLEPVLEPLDLGGGTTYCRNRVLVHALTSPIYVVNPA